MPLRDHCRPPLDQLVSWEELHGQWPAVIVQQLRERLPPGFVAAPHVHSGSQVEIDVATFEHPGRAFAGDLNGGDTTAVWAPAEPTVAVETSLPDVDGYEVRVYDLARGRRLVAAVAIVSPANKDRSEHRNGFVAKCAALLQKGIAVSIVDVVTTRRFNLYSELLAFIGQGDATLGDPPAHVYAASCRWGQRGGRTMLEAWSHRLEVGQPLPTLPLWLEARRLVPLDLEDSYEQACYDLRI